MAYKGQTPEAKEKHKVREWKDQAVTYERLYLKTVQEKELLLKRVKDLEDEIKCILRTQEWEDDKERD